MYRNNKPLTQETRSFRMVIILALGLAIGMLVPMMIDWSLFHTISPCRTIQQFEDGSTIQRCTVRK